MNQGKDNDTIRHSELHTPHSDFILLVEDSPDDQVLTERAFRRGGITNEIVTVTDGAEALDFLFAEGRHEGRDARIQPRLVVLDLKLPKMHGLEVLDRVRGDAGTRNLAVIVLSSSDEEQDMVESYRLGADVYVRKAVDFVAFCDTVRKLAPQWLELRRGEDRELN